MNKSRNQNKTGKGLMDSGKDVIHAFNLEKMKDGFLLEQNCRGNSKATVEYYKGNIDRYISYLEEQGLNTDTSSITKEQIKRYILYLKNAKSGLKLSVLIRWAINLQVSTDVYKGTKGLECMDGR